MANYSSLLAAVNAAITANGTGAITGPVLNSVLQQMIVSLGQGGYIFKGRAYPGPTPAATDPGSPDQNVFYIATTPGTYTNFSSIVVAAGECAILKGSGTSWSKEATGIDLVSVSQNTITDGLDSVISVGDNDYHIVQKLYTDNPNVNGFITKLYIDLTNYSGSYSTSGLYLQYFNRTSLYNGSIYFNLCNSNNEVLANFIQRQADVIQVTLNGIYFYLEIDYQKMEYDTSYGNEVRLTDLCFFKPLDPRGDIDTYRLKDRGVTEEKLQFGISYTLYNSQKVNDCFVRGKNLFDKDAIQRGYLVDYNQGFVQTGFDTEATSAWIDIPDGATVLYLSGNVTDTRAVAFRDSEGNMMKPVDSSYQPLSTYQYSSNIIYVPSTAKQIVFNVIFNNQPSSLDNTQLEVGSSATSYEPYKMVLKMSSIDDGSISKVKLDSELNEEIEDKLSADEILTRGKNLFDKNAQQDGYYVDWFFGLYYSGEDGVKASAWINIPEGATVLYLSGNMTPSMGVIYKDAEGNFLKPVDSNYQPLDTYQYSSRIFYVPTTAKQVCFTTQFSGSPANVDDTQLEVGSSATSYEPYMVYIKPSLMPPSEQLTKKFFVRKNGKAIDIKTLFNADYDIAVQMDEFPASPDTNGVLNIYSAKLIRKEDDSEYILNGAGVDDASPSNINNGYIGGNHGNPAALSVGVTSHDKTLADVGSVWEDSASVKFYLLKVIDSTHLLMISENIGSSSDWRFKTNPSGTLTYVSGAEHNSSIVISSVTAIQLYPSVKNIRQSIIIDGIEISNNGDYEADSLVVTEHYEIVDTPDMVAKLVANRPSGGYTVQPTFEDGDAVIAVSTYYNFTEQCKCVVSWTWEVKKECTVSEFFGNQSCHIKPSWITNYKRYMPNLLSWTDNGNTWDLRVPSEIYTDAQALTNGKSVGLSSFEDGKRPNRLVDMLFSSSLNINFNFGILEVANLTEPENYSDTVWYLRAYPDSNNTSFWKAYPRCIDSKLNTGGTTQAGVIVQGAVFRGWSERNTERTNLYCFKNGNDYYIYADWHEAKTDFVQIPSYLSGKQITVVDKSDNVTIHGDYATSHIEVSIASSNPMYGYMVLKI